MQFLDANSVHVCFTAHALSESCPGFSGIAEYLVARLICDTRLSVSSTHDGITVPSCPTILKMQYRSQSSQFKKGHGFNDDWSPQKRSMANNINSKINFQVEAWVVKCSAYALFSVWCHLWNCKLVCFEFSNIITANNKRCPYIQGFHRGWQVKFKKRHGR